MSSFKVAFALMGAALDFLLVYVGVVVHQCFQHVLFLRTCKG